MPAIGVISPSEETNTLIRQAGEELGVIDELHVQVGNVWNSLDIVEEMLANGVEVILARGTTADFLMHYEPRWFVIAITLSCSDLKKVVLDAQRLTGLPNPRIAIMSTHFMNRDVELYAEALGVDLTAYPFIGTLESIESAISEVVRNRADIVVGGPKAIEIAQQAGFSKTMLTPTSLETLKVHLAEAAKVVSAIATEQARTTRFENLIRHIREGLLHVEASGKIRIANPAAELMLGRTAGNLINHSIEDILPTLDFSAPLKAEPVEEIISVGDTTLIATLSPAPVGQDSSGIVVSLQETTRISQMDSHIRRSLNTKGLVAEYRFDDIWGSSPAIRETKRLAAEYAGVSSTILIFGETGTGKELLAQSIHNTSHQAGGPFVAVNCAALPATLLESELFGYEEGAFTGANRKGKMGLIELAHNGTLFLDEISEMEQYGQIRLLRFLQERQIMRLGGDKYIPVQVRIIAATNRDLDELVANGEFREDLYYRLKILTLNVPPLRERRDDIARIFEKMRLSWEARLGHKIRLAPDVTPILSNYPWPGNVRELANVVENLAVASRSRLVTSAVVETLLRRKHTPISSTPVESEPNRSSSPVEKAASGIRDDSERERIVLALAASGGNRALAAKRLGMHRTTLYRKILVHGIRMQPE